MSSVRCPQCSLIQFEADSPTCKRCNAVLSPVLSPSTTLSPLTSAAATGFQYVERGVPRMEGNELVVPAQVSAFPNVCAICGGEPHGEPLNRLFRWHAPWIYVFLLVNIILYAIIGSIAQKQHRIQVSLCAEHRRARTRGMLLGYLAAPVLSLLACFVGMAANHVAWIPFVFFFLGVVGLVVGLVYASRMENVLSAVRIDARESRFRGASPALAHASVVKVFE